MRATFKISRAPDEPPRRPEVSPLRAGSTHACVAKVAALLLAACASLGVGHAQDAEGNPPEAFESVWCVFLDRGAEAPALDEERAGELQRQHLAHLGRLRREGLALVSGPFEAPADESTRGLVLLRGDLTFEEVSAIAAADPAVIVGWFEPRILRWWTPAESMRFPQAEALAPEPEP